MGYKQIILYLDEDVKIKYNYYKNYYSNTYAAETAMTAFQSGGLSMKINVNRLLAWTLSICFMLSQNCLAEEGTASLTAEILEKEDVLSDVIEGDIPVIDLEPSPSASDVAPSENAEPISDEISISMADNVMTAPIVTLSEQEAVEADLAAITEESILSVPLTDEGYLIDPLEIDQITSGANGSTITWTTSDSEIISNDGMVTRPAENTSVAVTATAKLGTTEASKTFEFCVAGQSTNIANMHADIFPMYFDDFSNTEKIDSRIKTSRFVSGDTMTVENGKLKFNRTQWSSSEATMAFYMDEAENTMNGTFIAQYTLKKHTGVVRMRMYNANWNYITQTAWEGNTLTIQYRDPSDLSKRRTISINAPTNQALKFTYLLNVNDSRPTFSMWINNRAVLTDVVSATDFSPAALKWIQFYNMQYENYNVGYYTVDNFGIYKLLPEMTDEERVKADINAITYSSLIKGTTPLDGTAYSDLDLSPYGNNGSRIIWSSSNEDYIKTNGTVIRPTDTNEEVTLKAKVISGAYSMEKEIVIKVLGEHIVLDDLPEPYDGYIINNTFDSPDMENKLVTNTAGGGTVEIKDGALVINKTDSGSAQVGASIYHGASDKDAVTGIIGIEFDVENPSGKTVQIRSMDPNGHLYYSMSGTPTSMSANYSNDPNKGGSFVSFPVNGGDITHFNMMFDTANSSYWLWVNGELKVSRKYSRDVGTTSLGYTMFYIENVNTIKIDNYKVYNALMPHALRLGFDITDFSEDILYSEPPSAKGVIKSNLNLPKQLKYYTNITWSSSNPEIINPHTGAVTRPVDTDSNPIVILTAHLENSGMEEERQFTFRVLRNFSDSGKIMQEEVNTLTYADITEQNPAEIKTSLNLSEKGFYGNAITWSTDNSDVITSSGQVIRPRFDEEDAKVTLTATVGGKYSKDFEFIVKADDAPVDPMYTSDEDFFGIWNGGSFVKTPQLDYSYEGLEKVEECAKRGDYRGAKNELLSYFRTRNIPSPLALGTRKNGWVDARADGIFELSEEAAYYKGVAMITSDDYEPVSISLYNPGNISKVKDKGFEILAAYNECTSAYIIGTDTENKKMVPELTLTVNGATRSYRATKAATIRAGRYISKHQEGNDVLTAKMFGDFLGDETYRVLLSFDLSDMDVNDTISDAQLTLYAKKSATYAANKKIYVMHDTYSGWDEKTVCWGDLNFVLHNYNGLEGGYDWKGAKSSDIEFAYQVSRFMHTRNTLTEYKYTGNERYAYSILSQIMDFICDTGNQMPYPRSLDTGLRMQQWVPLMNAVKDSPYLTADFCTAFMKYMYQNFKYFPTRVNATGNWREYEQLAVVYATSAYPELTNSKSTLDASIESWKNAFNTSFMTDGTYIEPTFGYHRSSFAMYRDFKKACVESRIELPEEMDERLLKAAYYMALSKGSGGVALQYGDEGAGVSGANAYTIVSDWYNDREFQFIDSMGAKGTEPNWTSYHFPEGRYTFMRSDWEKNALCLFTNVRGGEGGHDHADDNGIVLSDHGKLLLVDSGKFTYNNYDPARMYGMSTRGHNTVVINDTSQRNPWTTDINASRGPIHRWLTNSKFDFLSQSTQAYPEHEHMRSILFVKSGFAIVSDKIMPNEKTAVNNYKQYWHMLPNSNITADNEKRMIYSDFSDGQNILIASADEAEATLEDGYYESIGSSVVDVKVGYFEKTGAGDVTLDTILYSTDYESDSISAERIDTGKPTDKATAMKFTISEKTGTTTYCYLYNYDFENGGAVTFDKYSSDARIALVGENEKGEITELMIADGSYINQNGKTLIKTDKTITDISSEAIGSRLELVTSDENIRPEDILVKGTSVTKSILFNKEAKVYTVSDGLLHPGSAAAEEKLESDNNSDGIGERPGFGNIGGGAGGGPGGSSGGSPGGGFGGNSGSNSDDNSGSTVESVFKDMDNHWAKEYVESLYKKGMVNGTEEGYFSPDRSIFRSEFVTMVMRCIGEKRSGETSGFEDVNADDWFAESVAAAVELGIISEDRLFRPQSSITREEMSKILCNISKYLNKQEAEIRELTFADNDLISDWAKEFVEYAVSNGLMNGKDNNCFDPLGNATRAEAATVLYRLLEK